jgi:hypothetical protein
MESDPCVGATTERCGGEWLRPEMKTNFNFSLPKMKDKVQLILIQFGIKLSLFKM